MDHLSLFPFLLLQHHQVVNMIGSHLYEYWYAAEKKYSYDEEGNN